MYELLKAAMEPTAVPTAPKVCAKCWQPFGLEDLFVQASSRASWPYAPYVHLECPVGGRE
jgi:hypothetical protein